MRAHRRWSLLAALVAVVACSRGPSPSAQSMPSGGSLEKLVAPIALYPDPLVAQILPASTHTNEVVEAYESIAGGGRPSEATASQWDPSIQALLSFPTVLKMMNDRLDWTTQLGDAVVANQGAVMDAIQAVRRQAQSAGNLRSNSYQVIQSQGSAIVIEPANPQYIYVPQYNPVTILAPPPYYYTAYDPIMTFGVGFAAGAATAYACSWGGYGYSSVTVNNNYHYNYSNTYPAYHGYNPSTGSWGTYHPQSGTYTGYNAKTGTYGAYNPETGKYGTYNPSTGAYNKNGQTGTYHPPSSTSGYHGYGSTDSWGADSRSSWGSGGGSGSDAFHGMDGGGWGAQDASTRGGDSLGGRSGGGWGGGGFDRGGGFGGGFGGFRGGGFGGFRGGRR